MTSSGSGASAADAPRGGQGRSRRRRRQVHRRAAPPSPQTVQQAEQQRNRPAQQSQQARPTRPSASRHLPKTFHGSLPGVEDAPFVEITVATSGIHPSTSRLVAFAATLHSADGDRTVFTGNRPASAHPDAGDVTGASEVTADADTPEEDTRLTGLVQQINPGEDPGPWHLHGYTEADLGQAPGFATVASLLFDLIDGRTLICHNTSLTWGVIQFEYRRAQRAANRGSQRGNSRGRRRNQRRPKKIAVPVPTRIVDTLGSARRSATPVEDPRLRSIAEFYVTDRDLVLPPDALPALGARSSLERADIVADDLLLADNRILFPLYRLQRDLADRAGAADNTPGGLAVADPAALTADRFGLQRSAVRVDATTSPRPFGNPGTPDGQALVEGMEFVVSPDVGRDPDVLIGTATRAGLVYSEKLNRSSSLVVCNRNHELRGKAMHGERKNIPLFTDEEFLTALEDVAPGSEDAGGTDTRPATPRIPAPQQGRNQGRKGGQRRNRNQSRGGRGRGGKSGQTDKTDKGGQPPKDGSPTDSGSGASSGRSSGRRRRRRSGQSRGGNQNNNQKQKQG